MMSQIDPNSSELQSLPWRERSPSETVHPSNTQLNNSMAQLLLDFSSRKSSGFLEVTSGEVSWKIFLEQGNIQYGLMSVQTLENLNYHLRYLNFQKALETLKDVTANEQNKQRLALASLDVVVKWLREKQSLSREEVSLLAQELTKEAIEPLFWLIEIHHSWEEINPDTPAISMTPSLPIPPLVTEFLERIKSWQKLADQINSPYQRPYLFKTPSNENTSSQRLMKLSQLMRGYSIHQIASLIKQDEIKLAQMLYSHVKSGEIYLRKPEATFNQLPTIPKVFEVNTQENANFEPTTKIQRVKIACVDDSPTILREMQRLLGEENYELTKIDNPIEAASVLFRVKPDLILMDISMPEINGYKLCSLLRNSKALSEVPIIMVTSRTGVIDKVRAKASGATGYLTKPFTKESLLEEIEKHLE